MKTSHFVIMIPLIFLRQNVLSQNKEQGTSAKYFSKIVVHAGDSMFVETDTLLVDTLIMHDRARLNFLTTCVIGISHAAIGERCQFNAAGRDGDNGDKLYRYGRSGIGGRNLRISIRFEKLGNLSILTNGGKGGYGLDGQNSLNAYESGEDGAQGGDGGRGGDVELFYLSPGFPVIVDEQSRHNGYYLERRKHAVFFNANGGLPGHGGKGGDVAPARVASTPVGTVASYSKEATKGRTGESGVVGINGKVRFLKTE